MEVEPPLPPPRRPPRPEKRPESESEHGTYRRKRFTLRIDWTFISFLVPIFAVLLALILWARSYKIENIDTDFGEIPERFVKLIMNKPVVPLKQAMTEKKAAALQREKTRDSAVPSRKHAMRLTGEQVKRIKQKGLLGVLGTKGKTAKAGLLAAFDTGKFSMSLRSSIRAFNSAKSRLDRSKQATGDFLIEGVSKTSPKQLAAIGIGDLKHDYDIEGAEIGEKRENDVEILGEIDKYEISGGDINAKAVLLVMQRNSGAFRYCYNYSLKTDPYLEGAFNLTFMINMDGRVEGNSFLVEESSITGQKLVNCITNRIAMIAFPHPRGEPVFVKIPFNFKAEDKD